MRFSYSNSGTSRSVAVTFDPNEGGKTYVIDGSHANFQAVLDAVRANDVTATREALDLDSAIRNALADVNAGFAYADRVITFEGEPVSERLAAVILDILSQEGNVKPFANFAARLYANPSKHSRDSLFGWINKHGINIDADGNMIAYKGVKVAENGDYVSITAGPGYVNGEATNGHLRNNVGDVVSIDRRVVDDNINRHCSSGLHAGTYNYASGFAKGVLLTVKIDPADVVSVPNDGYEKVRVSRYEVIATVEGEWTRSVVWDGSEYDYLDDDFSGEDDFLDY